jgi:hypothetical protein
MKTEENNNSQDIEKLKEIPKWTRKHAQNRTIPTLIYMVIYLCLFAGIAIPSYLRRSDQGGSTTQFICKSVVLVSVIAFVALCIPKLKSKLIERINRISRHLYGREGDVSISLSETAEKKKWVGHVVGLVFGFCVISSVFLGGKYNIPIKYMQPISALCFVPFLIFLYFWRRPKIGPLTLLWPILYAIHAIMIIVGVPILFTGNLTTLNMILPVFGYGLLTYIISYIYSRYALKKLKDITHLEGDSADGD